MITLHELHQQGSSIAEAVTAFGGLHPHPRTVDTEHCEPDWKVAEEHFLRIQSLILQEAAAPGARSLRERERRAENAATDVLQALARILALDPAAGRCPVCQTHNQLPARL
ncbi:hypothetical protein GCM10010449_64520 [Streptomyces rectiviolaceus]|uniref:Uncharacterized protein n=1 Tax=Streptomyces rectiviolaceus TaxID=332591 RepID=A0ABP6N3E9_9ACTN